MENLFYVFLVKIGPQLNLIWIRGFDFKKVFLLITRQQSRQIPVTFCYSIYNSKKGIFVALDMYIFVWMLNSTSEKKKGWLWNRHGALSSGKISYKLEYRMICSVEKPFRCNPLLCELLRFTFQNKILRRSIKSINKQHHPAQPTPAYARVVNDRQSHRVGPGKDFQKKRGLPRFNGRSSETNRDIVMGPKAKMVVTHRPTNAPLVKIGLPK